MGAARARAANDKNVMVEVSVWSTARGGLFLFGCPRCARNPVGTRGGRAARLQARLCCNVQARLCVCDGASVPHTRSLREEGPIARPTRFRFFPLTHHLPTHTQLLLMGASLLGSALLLKWSLSQLDPHAGSKKAAKHKKKEIQGRLGRSVTTNNYEDVVALDVVNPAAIDVGLDDIGGLAAVKDALHAKVVAPLQQPSLFSGSLLRQARGVLLYGPPGTGKTMLAKALARESGASFINVRPSSLESKWFGDTNKLVAATFSLATKLAPSIIFLDECDALLGRRRATEHEAVTALKTEFMALWDGLTTAAGGAAAVTVLGASNRPSELDEAVLRRFGVQCEVPLPDAAQREAILKLTLARHVKEAGVETVDAALRFNRPPAGLAGAERPLARVAARTPGFSGSDLFDLCSAAAARPVHEYMRAVGSGRRSGDDDDDEFVDATDDPTRSRYAIAPRQLTLADFEAALRTVKPTGVQAMAYRAPRSMLG